MDTHPCSYHSWKIENPELSVISPKTKYRPKACWLILLEDYCLPFSSNQDYYAPVHDATQEQDTRQHIMIYFDIF